ncbi:MAG: DUF465 domain-containing protein [Yoonia sp.]|nr:DUF465 domain-containing protein [Yoonia sp.]
MSHTPHELAEEFPDMIQKMHDLCGSDAHFGKMYDAYHDVNRAVHRAETNVAPASDAHVADLRKKRMHLKDQISAYLTKA